MDDASRAVDLVHRMLTGALEPRDVPAASRLQVLIASNLTRSGDSTVFMRYLGDPHSTSARRAVVDAVAEQLDHDESFRASVVAQTPQPAQTTLTAGGSISAAGRGIVANGSVSNNNNVNKKTHLGGIPVAVVAGIALFLVGGTAVVTLTGNDKPTLDGSSTCREFLAASPAAQTDALKRVYLANDRADLAGDPFVLQNGQYSCGSAPSLTLDGMARRFTR